jgi:hypothetical protein
VPQRAVAASPTGQQWPVTLRARARMPVNLGGLGSAGYLDRKRCRIGPGRRCGAAWTGDDRLRMMPRSEPSQRSPTCPTSPHRSRS